ncbi:predicted protein [Botrytis cinerea T4]|uniref:Uncharacterized protein n=1 Tax=Botryotinia fuckeliana (strain T4) TaxID=999810 RepID=G2YVX3_BOTF4|nr:predicted protein [Botrytis cinerea T4]
MPNLEGGPALRNAEYSTFNCPEGREKENPTHARNKLGGERNDERVSKDCREAKRGNGE